MNPADRINRKVKGVRGIALHQPFKAIINADHAEAVVVGFNCDSADHAVDAGCRAASDQNGYGLSSNAIFRFCHLLPESVPRETRQEVYLLYSNNNVTEANTKYNSEDTGDLCGN